MRIHRTLGALAVACFVTASALAQTSAQAEEQMKAAMTAARAVVVAGPATIPLVDQATLALPGGFAYIPGKEARGILYAMGNRPSDDTVGLILPGGDADWFVSVRYIKVGYIKDDDAKEWNADDMLDQIKSGTEEGNKDRVARGIPALEVVGWVEKPTYDAATHQLKWSMAARDKGAPSNAPQGVNYNTYALGREGFISMNLVTDMKTVEAEKPIAAKLLAGLTFKEGKRYVDFNSATDHIAEFGLAALVGGVAAKKLGLFALAAAFFAKFAKVILLAGLALGAGAFKWFRREKKPVMAPYAPAPGAAQVVVDAADPAKTDKPSEGVR